MDDTRTTSTQVSAPQFAVAGQFIETLAAGDFANLAAALEPDATLSALLPKGFREWQGTEAICGMFERWFGDVDDFEVVDAWVGQVGTRLQLRWRVRVRGDRLGDGAMLVEQHAYADTSPGGRISELRMLCSGFCREQLDV